MCCLVGITAGKKLLFFRFFVNSLRILKYQGKILKKQPLKHCVLVKFCLQPHHVIQADLSHFIITVKVRESINKRSTIFYFLRQAFSEYSPSQNQHRLLEKLSFVDSVFRKTDSAWPKHLLKINSIKFDFRKRFITDDLLDSQFIQINKGPSTNRFSHA